MWTGRLISATVLVLSFTIGCESLGLSSLVEDPGPREHVLPGPPDKQAAALESALREHDLRPVLTPGDDRASITCRSKSGQSFEIVLRRTIDGRTCARVALSGPPDADTRKLLAELDLR
jgi:hypothetical protein